MQNKFLHLVIFLFLTAPLYSLSGASNHEIVNDEPQTENSHVMVEIIDWYSNVSSPEIQICIGLNSTNCDTIIFDEGLVQGSERIFSLANSTDMITLKLASENDTIGISSGNDTLNLTLQCVISECDGLKLNTFGQLNQSNSSFVEISLEIRIGDFGDDDFDGILNYEDHCSESLVEIEVDEQGCSWLDQDYDKDGVINGIDPCPSLFNVTICGMNYSYVPTYIINSPDIEMSPTGDLFVYVTSRYSYDYNWGELLFFEVNSDLCVTEKFHYDYWYITDLSCSGMGPDFGSQIVDSNTNRPDWPAIGYKYFTPDGKYFISETDNENQRVVVNTSSYDFDILSEDDPIFSEINYTDPRFTISYFSKPNMNLFSNSHWQDYSDDFEINHNGNLTTIKPEYEITSASFSDSRDQILLLDEQEEDGTRNLYPVNPGYGGRTLNHTIYTVDLNTGNKSLLVKFQDVDSIGSVEVSMDGSTIMVERIYTSEGSSYNGYRDKIHRICPASRDNLCFTRDFGYIELFERDIDDDGVPDRVDAFPFDSTKWEISELESDSDSSITGIGAILVAIIAIGIIGLVMFTFSDETGDMVGGAIAIPFTAVGGALGVVGQAIFLVAFVAVAVALAPCLAFCMGAYLILGALGFSLD